MNSYSLRHVSDAELRRRLPEVVQEENQATAVVLAHVAEFDSRRLYADEGYPSMFEYCTRKLRLSEQCAFKRIRAGRLARRFPEIFQLVARGQLHLAGLVILSAYLTRENGHELLGLSIHKTKAEIETLLACRFPKPDVPTMVAPITDGLASPRAQSPNAIEAVSDLLSLTPDVKQLSPGRVEQEPAGPLISNVESTDPPPRVTPLAPLRFALQLTMSQELHDKLRRAQELLGHADVPNVLERALDELLARLERRQGAVVTKPRASEHASKKPRHISAGIRHAVYARDQGRCTFVSDSGHRCEARGRLELDHVQPVARGGTASPGNLRLRCRAHNQLEADRVFGVPFMEAKRQETNRTKAPAEL